MNVLHINDYRTAGGCEVLVAATIDGLRERGIRANLFTIDDVADQRLSAWRYLNNSAARTALHSRMRQIGPDIVHLHNFYHVLSPGILRELIRLKKSSASGVVMTAHDYHLICPNSGGMWFRGFGKRRTMRPRMHPMNPATIHWPWYVLTRQWDHRSFAHSALKTLQHAWNYWVLNARRVIDAVICPSRFMQRLIRAAGLRAIYLPHPAPALDHGPGPRYGPLRLVFAGRIEPEKGLAEFLMAMPERIGGLLTVIGEGSEMARCRSIVRARGLQGAVEFTGRLPHAQTLAIIARCHVLVLPSLCLENQPLSLIEALSTGANVLVSDQGGMREIVEEFGVGYMFAPEDTASLTQALSDIAAAHADGTLNRFDVRERLQRRASHIHFDGLLKVYAAVRATQPVDHSRHGTVAA